MDFLAHPTLLAPMEGVGHPLFRALVAEQGGIGMLCTEFVRVHEGLRGQADATRASHFEQQVVKHPGVPLSVQVMGKDEGLMAEAAEIVEAAGADVVDINLGCPSPKAVKGGVGSAMLKDLALLERVLKAMRAKVRGRLSAKIRAGFEDERALDIARVVEGSGCDFIAVHPRKRSDRYRGVADWRIIRDIKRTVSIPVIGNGDCWYASDFQRMQAETGCDAVMVGRPAIRNPWLLQQAAQLRAGEVPYAPEGADLVAWIQKVGARYDAEWRSPFKAAGKLKELIKYLGRAVDDERAFMKAALRLQSCGEIAALAEDALGALPAERIDLQASPRIGLERSGSVEDQTLRAIMMAS